VPVRAPAKPNSAVAGNKVIEGPAGGKTINELGEKIDLDQASVQELQRLPGISTAMKACGVGKRQEKLFKVVEALRLGAFAPGGTDRMITPKAPPSQRLFFFRFRVKLTCRP